MKTLSFSSLSLLFLCACSSPGTKPDDMSAAHHEAEAAEHHAQAEEHGKQFDPNDVAQRPALQERINPVRTQKSDIYYPPEIYNPTERHRRAAGAHELVAKAHEKAAAALEKYEDGVCGQLPAATRAMCPLMGQLKTVTDVDGGVHLVPADDVNLDAWAAHIQCHVAYAGTAGHVGMDECPLFARGVRAEKVPGGVNLVIGPGGADPIDVAKLRAAARAHL